MRNWPTTRRWLSDLERRPRVTRLRLAGLAPREVAELVADQVPEDSGPDPVAAVVRAAEGNPLYALELAGSGARVPPASITEAVLAKAAGVARIGAGGGRPGLRGRWRHVA